MSDLVDPVVPISQRLAAIRAWEAAPPTAGLRGRGGISNRLSSALTGTLKHAIPVAAIETALGTASDLALRSSARQGLCKRAGVAAIEDIRGLPLERSDALARHIKHRAMALAAGSGAATGVGGAALIAADIPALLTEEEKQAAIQALRATAPGAPLPSLAEAAWREGVERLSERELTKQALAYSVHNLARQLGVNLAKRKAAAAVPVLGAVIGGSVNAWTIHDLARSTQFAFQAWRLGHWGAQAALPVDETIALPAD